MANVTKMPATLSRFTAAPLADTAKRKVAACARASTDHEEQQSSYEVQVDYYTHYIQSRDDWEFVGVYAEEGITGCNTKNRDGFIVSRSMWNAAQRILNSRKFGHTVDDLLLEIMDDPPVLPRVPEAYPGEPIVGDATVEEE